ncbi:MAG TPA: thymidylate kinase [Thermoplasmata archaeon]|nr:thymidylate kinase [Thermoplasmata archaeon]
MTGRTYGTPLPGMPKGRLSGRLIVIEGADGSGRTTEVAMLKEWLEVQGHSVVDTGLRRSTLVSEQIDAAKQGHTLASTTLALFYAVDFADQLENKIIPSLAAGSTVLADRYIYTLMARAIARGASREWAQVLYEFALIPDVVIFLEARTDILLHRAIMKYGSLDYWESGMDLCLSPDRFDSFFLYQERLRQEFAWMAKPYGFHRVDANRNPGPVHLEVKRIVAPLYGRPIDRVERPPAGPDRRPITGRGRSAASSSGASRASRRRARPDGGTTGTPRPTS